MKRPSKLRVLIVDDHFVVRMGLAGAINAEPDLMVAGEAASGAEAIDQYRALRPDLVLMDLRLPRMEGAEATATICSEFPDARIIMLTISEGDEDIWRALQAGARAYLIKTAERGDLLDTIRAVARGERRLPPAVAATLAARMSRQNLSSRETEILKLIVGGKSNKEIGGILSISEVTVKRHVSHLLEKLGASDRTQAATLAIQRGIVHLD